MNYTLFSHLKNNMLLRFNYDSKVMGYIIVTKKLKDRADKIVVKVNLNKREFNMREAKTTEQGWNGDHTLYNNYKIVEEDRLVIDYIFRSRYE